jgi:hypothetical protein
LEQVSQVTSLGEEVGGRLRGREREREREREGEGEGGGGRERERDRERQRETVRETEGVNKCHRKMSSCNWAFITLMNN